MTSPILVEFCGLPGAGKSTLCEAVLDGMTRAGVLGRDGSAAIRPNVPARQRLGRKLALTAGAVGHQPVGSAALATRILAAAETGPRDAAGRLVQWTTTQGLYAAARADGGTSIFDEGVAQALWSIGLRSDPTKVLDCLVRTPNRWYRADLLVLVDVPVELALERLGRRVSRHSRTQSLSGPAQAAELQAGQRLLERLVAWFAALPAASVVTLRVCPSDHPDDDAGSAVTQRVLELAAARTA